MLKKKLTVTDFKARCTRALREVETGQVVLEITRHGRTVAVVERSKPPEAEPTVAEWIGSGKGLVTFTDGYDAEAPAFPAEDWESFKG